jgi:uncharacterized protein with von Willebrand factor type A (vWA) domain
MLLGDARQGKLLGNLAAFARTLRRAGLPVDASRMALAAQAAREVGLARREDLSAALEAVLVGRERDRAVFRELFDAFFRDPELASKLLAQMLPSAEGRADPPRQRPRVREALAAPRAAKGGLAPPEQALELDACMSASDRSRLRHADFNALGADEYRLLERLAREVPLPMPRVPGRRPRRGMRGARADWPRLLREAGRHGGECAWLPRLRRRSEALPLLLLVDVSGSMERYARLLLAFLHAATRGLRRRDVFAVGTSLSDLTPAFALPDGDDMLAAASAAVADFAGGTRLGESLAELRRGHARRLVGRRTLVLLISDGLDTGEPQQLREQLLWLRRHSRRLLWLNPLLRFDAYQPSARGAAALHTACDAMLAVHNLASLEQLAGSLARLLGPR